MAALKESQEKPVLVLSYIQECRWDMGLGLHFLFIKNRKIRDNEKGAVVLAGAATLLLVFASYGPQ